MEPNMLPMLLTLHESAADEGFDDIKTRILHVVVHAWAEGHIAAPGHRLTDDPNADQMPAPPFPDPKPGNAKLAEVLDDASDKFAEGQAVAALTYAAALGWAAGYQEGLDCPGCALAGADHPGARAMRGGTMEVSFRMPGAPGDIFELAEQMGISPESALEMMKRGRKSRGEQA